eukprot:COSAG05_NODE_10972_length_536_cov_17.430206_1_plen_90_part_00
MTALTLDAPASRPQTNSKLGIYHNCSQLTHGRRLDKDPREKHLAPDPELGGLFLYGYAHHNSCTAHYRDPYHQQWLQHAVGLPGINSYS